MSTPHPDGNRALRRLKKFHPNQYEDRERLADPRAGLLWFRRWVFAYSPRRITRPATESDLTNVAN